MAILFNEESQKKTNVFLINKSINIVITSIVMVIISLLLLRF